MTVLQLGHPAHMCGLNMLSALPPHCPSALAPVAQDVKQGAAELRERAGAAVEQAKETVGPYVEVRAASTP